MPTTKSYTFQNSNLKLPYTATIIPKEYTAVDIRDVTNETFCTYMVITAQNNTRVEAEEYHIHGTDLSDYYNYGKKVKVNEKEKNKVFTNQLKLPF